MVVEADAATLVQIVKQLAKLHDVTRVLENEYYPAMLQSDWYLGVSATAANAITPA